MADLARGTAAGFTAYGITLHPLRLKDVAALDVWLQDGVRQEAHATAVALVLAGDRYERWCRAAIAVSRQIDCATAEGLRRLCMPAGLVRQLELASDGAFNETELTRRIAEKEAGLPATFALLLRELMHRLNGLGGDVTSTLEAEEAGKAEAGGSATPDPSPAVTATGAASSAP